MELNKDCPKCEFINWVIKTKGIRKYLICRSCKAPYPENDITTKSRVLSSIQNFKIISSESEVITKEQLYRILDKIKSLIKK